MISLISRLFFLGVMLSTFPLYSQEPTPDDIIMLNCENCAQTEEATRLYLEQIITDVTKERRLINIKTNNLTPDGLQTGEYLYFIYSIESSNSSERAGFIGTTAVVCPRCEDS